MTSVTVLSGPERRRRWTSSEKLRLVAESLSGGLASRATATSGVKVAQHPKA
jgi:transposase-like protein